MNNWLDVSSVDLRVEDNAEPHLTSKYTWQNESKVVVRRGLPFNLRMKTRGRIFNPDIQVLVLEFTLEEKVPFRDEDRIHRVRVRSSKEVKLPSREWMADLVGIDESTIDVRLTFPPKAPIACWKLKVLSGIWTNRHQTTELRETFFSELHSPLFYVICNPFVVEDETYMSQRQIREAYLFQDGELYFSGTAVGRRKYSFQKKPWMHSQFDENTMKVSMFLLAILSNNYLKDLPGLSMDDRGSVPRIARKLSFAINRYLLRGNWEKELPSDGRAPSTWLGSAEIIDEFSKTKRPVKYAQCWVYASVFVTILRTLGVPCRTVTCIESAHDADNSLTMDRAYLKTRAGGFEPMDSSDSNWETTWNFHVWTELWTRRHDLPAGYDGWQVIDATPQERSEKLFQCGPMSVKAIREGRLELLYDGGFIYSEVNADLVRWFYERDPVSGELKLITAKFGQDTVGVGRAILTPSPRNFGYPLDLTTDYKAPEGTSEERLMHIRALKSAGAAERHEKIRLLYGNDIDHEIKEDIQVRIEEIDKVIYGDSIVIDVSIKNTSDFPRTLRLSIVIITQFHTGAEASKINQFNEELLLAPREGESLRLFTAITEYAKHISYLRELAAVVSASVLETQQAIFIEEKFQIAGSSVAIQAPTVTKVGEKVRAIVTFKNPLNETLHDTELILHSGSLSRPTIISRFPRQVAGRQRVKAHVKFRAVDEGPRLLIATVNSKEISHMTATHYVRSVNANILNNDDRPITF